MKAKAKPQRWRFLRDNDGHDYLVKDEDVEVFDSLLDAATCDDYGAQEEFCRRFDECRTARHIGAFSFTDPKGSEP